MSSNVKYSLLDNQGDLQHIIDTEEEEGEEDILYSRMGEMSPPDYSDYYEYLSTSATVRPICITEGVDFSKMSLLQRMWWWVVTFLKFLSIIILSVRTDRLGDWDYLTHHYLHYTGLLVFALAAWSPQVVDSLGNMGYLDTEGMFAISNSTAAIICTFGLFYYILSISWFFLWLAPRLRILWGKGNTLRFWEFFVSLGWQVQTLGFWALTLAPPLFTDALASVPPTLTSVLGVVLVVGGIGSKMGAVYGTGYNTYYWYDMVLDTPNAYFSEVGIYKFCGSPTYTLGRGTSFGAALHYRSLPMLVAAIVDLVLINLFNRWVEQPSVKRMYFSPNKSEQQPLGIV